MLFINRPETDPYFNIAAEEYILKNYSADVMMLWQSKPSVIIGKHQNALAEVNRDFVEKNQIPVIRRISGGGTVFHDLNNINYSVIKTGERKDRLIDFRYFLKPVIGFLKTLGVQASFEGKNNLFVDGRKISGNSAHVFKNKVLHHGTLLFDSNLDMLEEAIKSPELKIDDKAVQSIRATVTNIHDHLPDKMPFFKFIASLQKYLIKYHNIKRLVNLSAIDHQAIHKLVEEKYRQWEWNFGYSPKYVISNQTANEQVTLEVKNGVIVQADFTSEMALKLKFEEKLTGLPHRKTEILKMLLSQIVDENIVVAYLKLLGF